jgi:hypothetical protein
MPGFGRHFIGLVKMVNNVVRFRDEMMNTGFFMLTPKFREQEMIQQQKKGRQHGPDQEKQDHKSKK